MRALLLRFGRWLRSFRAKPDHDCFAVLDRLPGVQPLNPHDERERRAEVNAASSPAPI